MPALLANGLLKHTEKLDNWSGGYYRLSSVLILLSFLALLRIKAVERMKDYAPGELGKILGLDRIPEIKTLREKLTIIADDNLKSFIRALYNTENDILPNTEEKRLIVSLHNLNNESSDEMARFLFAKLNDTETVFPGTNLRLFFKLVSDIYP